MGLFDVFNAGKVKKENEELKELLTPEMQDAATLKKHISDLESQKLKAEKDIEKLEEQKSALSTSIEELKSEAIFFEDAIVFQDFGLNTTFP